MGRLMLRRNKQCCYFIKAHISKTPTGPEDDEWKFPYCLSYLGPKLLGEESWILHVCAGGKQGLQRCPLVAHLSPSHSFLPAHCLLFYYEPPLPCACVVDSKGRQLGLHRLPPFYTNVLASMFTQT